MPRDIYDVISNANHLNIENLQFLYKKYNGPVWVYDASIIINQINRLRQFDTIRFAQKACSNIHILRLIGSHGVKVDAVSLGEIERALLSGFQYGENSDEIIFSSDLLEEPVLKRILNLNILVNIGSIDMLHQLGICSYGHRVWLRINPGFGSGHSKKTNTGGENSKHGIWYKDIPLALSYVHRYGLRLLGFHIHIGSGVDYNILSKVCDVMVDQVCSSREDLIVISAGGGLSIPYYVDNINMLNIDHYFNLWNSARNRISDYLGHTVRLEIEPGRFLVAESGMLISQVRAVKDAGARHFVLVDVGFNDLVRPVMYGSYHHVSLIPAEKHRNIFLEPVFDTIIGGPICESGDVFTQTEDGDLEPRSLPYAKVGDYLVFHDTGAYGSSMSSNYNSRPFLPEVLFKDGNMYQIRRKQTLKELLSLEMCDLYL
ncbi:diaminopimelate decarboxylase [Blochmannia endosymbiont of Polyrhachis (Hedomyrma) turneri]|uniref:diaminopimelate decarboxylase n=1 Tax=Blochmannia endosymbiont of Polyrhachis (Hedomyrma) turneri TaxID=1505596 RepID=UPI00061A7777|nr:diaminopimelate decarboxylase [Blochmannia endosymbiont of Polyrhachis (Hedomyrma) turneri]AKC59835.1 Diaminopimelate decarboxylase [Blochmannia endosymbiont of Polyrhachis (Hedomyrma) turneri]